MDEHVNLTGILKLIVVQARVTRSLDYFGEQDPYFILKYFCLDRADYDKHSTKDKFLLEKMDPKLKAESKVLYEGGKEPFWNQQFDVPVSIDFKLDNDMAVVDKSTKHFFIIKLMDKDPFFDDHIGSAFIDCTYLLAR